MATAFTARPAIGLTKLGSYSLTLSGNNSYLRGTTVSGGTLQLGNVNALGSSNGSVVLSGTTGVLDLNGFSPNVGALSGSAGSTITSNATGHSDVDHEHRLGPPRPSPAPSRTGSLSIVRA